jgi:hypothetical protein
MDPSRYPIPIGILLMALAVIFLIGWNFFNWGFVDPFFCTLVFFAGPFFIAMGFAEPRLRETQTGVRIRT